MSFTCPVCLRVKQKKDHVALNNCEHFLCWTCCGKLMRENLTVAVKCPLCRSLESERLMRRIRRNQAEEAENIALQEETEAEAEAETDNDEDYDDYDDYETVEEGEIVGQQERPARTVEDFSDYQNNFINGRFSFRYSRCKFITINK
jgi:hypothetical protein